MDNLTEIEDDEARIKRQKKNVMIMMAAAFAVMAIAFGLTLSGTVNLAGKAAQSSGSTEFDKVTFTAKYFSIHALWFAIAIGNVARHRVNIQPLAG